MKIDKCIDRFGLSRFYLGLVINILNASDITKGDYRQEVTSESSDQKRKGSTALT